MDQYIQESEGELDDSKLPHLLELKYRAMADAVDHLGGVPDIRNVFIGFQQLLYTQEPAA